MTTLFPLNAADYVTSPRMSVSSGVALGISLLAVVSKPAPLPVRFAAKRLRGAVVGLQEAWGAQLDVGEPTVASRDADTRSDRSVRATSMCIEAYVLLGPEATPHYAQAVAVQQRMFPDGLRFLTLPFDQQWAHCERLMKLVKKDQTLAADLEALVPKPILAELHAAHEAYGTALGITAPRKAEVVVSLLEPLAALRAAISGYALQVVAMQDYDAARIPAARQALAPLDDYRARQARRRALASTRPAAAPTTEAGPTLDPELEEDESVTPQTPVPEVEDTDDAAA